MGRIEIRVQRTMEVESIFADPTVDQLSDRIADVSLIITMAENEHFLEVLEVLSENPRDMANILHSILITMEMGMGIMVMKIMKEVEISWEMMMIRRLGMHQV